MDDIITAAGQESNTAEPTLVVKGTERALVTVVTGDSNARQSLRAVLEGAGYSVNDSPKENELGEVVPLAELERRAIDHALRVTGGRVAKAAKLLGIGRATLYRRLAERAALNKQETPPLA